MRRFWDRRAREDPLYFVDNRRGYGDPDLESFWSGGEQSLASLLGALGIEVSKDEVVLDIGCGVGRLTRALAGRADHVLALDVSTEMLERARELNPDLPNVRWLLGDGASLRGIADASVDGCVSLVVFQHIPSQETVLSYVHEMGRVLKTGGWAAFRSRMTPRFIGAPDRFGA